MTIEIKEKNVRTDVIRMNKRYQKQFKNYISQCNTHQIKCKKTNHPSESLKRINTINLDQNKKTLDE